MANTTSPIQYQSVGHYRGIKLLMVNAAGKRLFVAWMDKFYSSEVVDPLFELIDQWWTLRQN